jgi:hypothetical protein
VSCPRFRVLWVCCCFRLRKVRVWRGAFLKNKKLFTGALFLRGQGSRGPASIRVLPTRAMAFLRSVALCAAVASSAAFAPAGGCCNWHAAAPRLPRAANGPALPPSLAQLADVHSTVELSTRTAARGTRMRAAQAVADRRKLQRMIASAAAPAPCMRLPRAGGRGHAHRCFRCGPVLRRCLGGHGSGSCVRARYQDRPEGVAALQRSGVWRDSAS